MNLREELAWLTGYVSLDEVESRTRRAISSLGEEVDDVVPSIVLAEDGARLETVLLLTAHFHCEVRVRGDANETETEFDVVRRGLVRNFRVRFWKQELARSDGRNTVFQLASVGLVHSFDTQIATTLNYAGPEREEWFKRLLKAVPVSVVLNP